MHGVGILPAAPDAEARAVLERRKKLHYAQQLEQQAREQREVKEREKGQIPSDHDAADSHSALERATDMS